MRLKSLTFSDFTAKMTYLYVHINKSCHLCCISLIIDPPVLQVFSSELNGTKTFDRAAHSFDYNKCELPARVFMGLDLCTGALPCCNRFELESTQTFGYIVYRHKIIQTLLSLFIYGSLLNDTFAVNQTRLK